MEVELIGRDEELQRMERFLDGVQQGARAVLIEGEAGAGKSVLWEAALERARAAGARVAAARPTEAETSYAHAALGDLLGGAPEALEELPRPQRRALEVALLLAEVDGERPDRQAVARATLSALRALARQVPLVVAVDDVQWLDPPTAGVLAFAARRLADERIGLLLAQRTADHQPAPLGLDRAFVERLDRVPLPPLSLGAVQRLLQLRLDWVPSRPVLRHLHELAGGNPFFALELGRALASGMLHLEPGEPLPVTLDALVSARLEGLAPATRRGLAVAASMRQPALEVVEAVAGDGVLAEAERAQIVAVRDGVVRFAHPLLASGAYAAADPATRRDLHAAVAVRVSDPEERARHLAMAATGPDEPVASALEDAARHAESRGAPAAAADLLERAVRLTPSEGVRDAQRRAVDAAFGIFQSGDSRRAREMLDEVIAAMDRGPARARALVRLSLVRGYDDDLRAAEALLRQAADEAEGDDELVASVRNQLSSMLFRLRERLVESVEHSAAAAGAATDLGTIAEANGSRLLAEAALGHPNAPSTLRRVLELQPGLEHRRVIAQPLFQAGFAWLWWDDLERAQTVFETLRARAVELGDEGSLAYVLVLGAQIDCVRGDVHSATRHADEGYALTEQTGQATVGAYLLALRALADAIAGDVDQGRERAERALAIAARTNGRPAEHFARAALGLLELSVSRPAEVRSALGPLVDFLRAEQIAEPGTARVVPDQIEALIALGDLEGADELLGWYAANAERLARRSALAAAARCRGLLAGARRDVDGAVAELTGALELHESVPIPLELGRTQLALGSALRRSRQRRAAREALESARDTFAALGARVWGGRAEAELHRLGGRPPSAGALTPTERRVAELVCRGLQTKQVAAALFVSPKTVEGHLTRIYGKLGVGSRTELAHYLADGSDDARGAL
jgi:DNA-binding CsgD family transcriptional regulator